MSDYTFRDLPDITESGERYHPFPQRIDIEVSVQLMQKYIKDEAIQDFLDYIALENPYVLSTYLYHQQEDFTDWLINGGGAQ